jgi:hypothetical protein
MATFALRASIALALLLAFAACGGGGGGDGDDDSIDAGDMCTPTETRCQGNTFQTCSSGGEWMTTEFCQGVCDDDLGCLFCTPDQRFCEGEIAYMCNGDGNMATMIETCTGNSHCMDGVCVDPCVAAAETRSYLGCEYWAVDLDNAHDVYTTPDQIPLFGCGLIPTPMLTGPICYDPNNTTPDPNLPFGNKVTAGLCDPGPSGPTCPAPYTCQTTTYCGLNAQISPFAIVVANPQTFPVMVTLTNATGTTMTQTVAPNAVQPLFPQNLGFADASLDHTEQARKAYRLTSTAPVVAYQFNPLDNVNVFSNGGSLLIPRTAYDERYVALTAPTLQSRPDSSDYNGYIAIVAWQDDTEIEITASVATKAGYGTPAIPALAAGVPTRFTLDSFEVLLLPAAGNGDLTGTSVASIDPAKTVGVFAGAEAAFFPHNQPPPGGSSGPCCADHVEEMLFPTSTWGMEFAIARSQVRLPQAQENDIIRIVAQRDNTMVTFTPNAIGANDCGATLAAGASCTAEIAGDTVITATQPITVGRFLKSVLYTDGISQMFGTGDPSMAIAVPTEQFRTSYNLLVPQQYMANFASIVIPQGGTVMLDGADVTGQVSSMFGTWRAGRIMLAAGVHRIDCPAGCGVEVYGWSRAVSYMFAGGLDLQQIVID